jgi:hypothetical protein
MRQRGVVTATRRAGTLNTAIPIGRPNDRQRELPVMEGRRESLWKDGATVQQDSLALLRHRQCFSAPRSILREDGAASTVSMAFVMASIADEVNAVRKLTEFFRSVQTPSVRRSNPGTPFPRFLLEYINAVHLVLHHPPHRVCSQAGTQR